MLPFLDLSRKDGLVGQIQTQTRVVQPFSSYAALSLPDCYGGLLTWTARRCGIASEVLLRIFDNHLIESPLYLSDQRESVLECRTIIAPQASSVTGPAVL